MTTMTAVSSSAVDAAAPTVAAPAFIGTLDAASTVMALRAATRQERVQEASGAARTAELDRQTRIEARLDAMQRAQAAQHRGGFWSGIAEVARKVAIVAAIVVGAAASAYTLGTSGLLAAAAVAALSAAPVALPEVATAVADAAHADATWRTILQGVAAAICIVLAFWNPAGAISGASQVASSASELQQVSARLASLFDGLGRLTGSGAQIEGCLAGLQEGRATLDEADARAGAQRHEAHATREEQRREDAMNRLEDVYREAVRASRAYAQMIDNQDRGARAVWA